MRLRHWRKGPLIYFPESREAKRARGNKTTCTSWFNRFFPKFRLPVLFCPILNSSSKVTTSLSIHLHSLFCRTAKSFGSLTRLWEIRSRLELASAVSAISILWSLNFYAKKYAFSSKLEESQSNSISLQFENEGTLFLSAVVYQPSSENQIYSEKTRSQNTTLLLSSTAW